MHSVSRRLAAAVAVLVGVLGVSAALGAGKAATTVTVSLNAKRQVIQGFGSSARIWTDPHVASSANIQIPPAAQAQILTALYRRLGLTRVRDSLDQGIQTSRGGPFTFSGKLGDAQVPFVKQLQQYGLRTFFPSPVYLEDWMQANDPAGYVDYAMGVLTHWKDLGLEPPYFSPVNEPQITHDFSPQWMHDVVLQLGQRLRAAGFKTRLVVPDDENPTDAYRRSIAVLQDPKARQYVGALAYHVYKWNPADMVRMRQLAAQYKLPLWMTEYSNTSYTDWSSAFDWAQKMHFLLVDGGVNAVDYLWGFFGSWVRTDTMISIDFDHGVFRSFSPTPIYWITGQYSRYVRPGFTRVATRSSSSAVLVSAYIGPTRAILIATNPTNSGQSVRFKIVGGKVTGVIRPIQSSTSEHWKSLAPVRPRNGSFTTSLPSQSVTTFIAVR